MHCGKIKLIFLCLFLWIVGSVYAIDDDFEELARNGGFEEPILDTDWTIEMRAGQQANVTRDDEEFFAGEYSAFFEVITFENDRPQLTQKSQAIEAGEQYTLSFWAKAEAVRPAEMHVIQSVDPWSKYASEWNLSIGTEWMEYWMTFESPADDNNARLVFRFHNSDVDVWVDNVHFYVGEHIEEEDMTVVIRAVNHNGKLAITWGKIRIISDF